MAKYKVIYQPFPDDRYPFRSYIQKNFLWFTWWSHLYVSSTLELAKQHILSHIAEQRDRHIKELVYQYDSDSKSCAIPEGPTRTNVKS